MNSWNPSAAQKKNAKLKSLSRMEVWP